MASLQAAPAAAPPFEVVVLGGNFAGMQVMHYLLRQIFPQLERLAQSRNYHLSLVSPNSHYFFKIAAPRALTKPNAIPFEKIFKPIDDARKQYFEACAFIQGKAIGLDPKAKTVTIRRESHNPDRVLRYNALFICTGTRSASPLWSIHDDHEHTIAAFQKMHECLPKTKTLLIVGGGPVGVETAGEIAAAYPDIKITLLAGSDVLQNFSNGLRKKAKERLMNAGVTIIPNLRLAEYADTVPNTFTLNDGHIIRADMFIDCTGARKINSEYLPEAWLDPFRRVVTRHDSFRVQGDDSAPADCVYAVGDIVAGSANTALELEAMIIAAGSSFGYDVSTALGYKPKPGVVGDVRRIFRRNRRGVAQKEFKPLKNTIAVPIGPNDGVGKFRGIPLPSIAVKKFKGKTFMVEMVEPHVTGSKFTDNQKRRSPSPKNDDGR